MRYEYTESGNLKVTIDADEQRELKQLQDELGESFCSDRVMYDLFEPLVCNSELQWTTAESVGALTDAPILAVQDADAADNEYSAAYGYMDYALRSPQEDLLNNGYCIFLKG